MVGRTLGPFRSTSAYHMPALQHRQRPRLLLVPCLHACSRQNPGRLQPKLRRTAALGFRVETHETAEHLPVYSSRFTIAHGLTGINSPKCCRFSDYKGSQSRLTAHVQAPWAIDRQSPSSAERWSWI